jgi:MYXO-CTERM domain-containing protein
MRYVSLSLLSALLLSTAGPAQAGTASCSLQYQLPADIPVSTMDATDSTFQQFGWESFLGLNAPRVGGQISVTGDNDPQWAAWSSTVDLLLCQESPAPHGCVCPGGDCATSGTHFYPSVCSDVPGGDGHRVLGQIGKVDDAFEEAATGGLSGDPVVDRFGGFLRYEILLSPATYDDIITQKLYDEADLMARTSDVNLGCGLSSYTGGDPADGDMGTLVLKVAWMDVTDALRNGGIDASMYHLEDLLVFTPGYRNSDGMATCGLRTMALVGMHVAHKTFNQPNWIWSTFEHDLNAPDCTGPIPGPFTQQPNTSCADAVDVDYNLYGQLCNGMVQACAACNTPPAANGNCDNPSTSVGDGYCLDLPPAANGGISALCRQVPISSYPEAETWNTACQGALGDASVWSNYSLISSQWGTSAIAAGCSNVAGQIFSGSVNDSLILPKVQAGTGTAMKPLLGNTTMESYDRSNCIGCHAKATFKNSAGAALSTDLMYFLQLQVSAPASERLAFIEDVQGGGGGGGGGGSGGCAIAPQPGGGGAWVLMSAVVILALRRRARA